MENSGLGILKHANSLGYEMWVSYDRGWDDQHPENKRTKSWRTAWRQVQEVDEAHVFFWDREKISRGYVYIVNGLSPEETLCDYSAGDTSAWIEQWYDEYFEKTSGG